MTGAPPPLLVCAFCGCSIPSVRQAFQKVTGWERHRAAGGTNALALRKTHDEFACLACVDKLRAGIDPNQPSLI